MHTFQITSFLVLALIFNRTCWIFVIHFFKKIMHFVYISITYLGNMLVIEWEVSSLMIAWSYTLKKI